MTSYEWEALHLRHHLSSYDLNPCDDQKNFFYHLFFQFVYSSSSFMVTPSFVGC